MITMTLAEAERWTQRAAQAFVWARLVVEIPKQVEAHAVKARADRRELDKRAAFYPDDAEIVALQDKTSRALTVRCELVTLDPGNRWACTTARIARKGGTSWQDEREIAVEFALCRDGEVKVHCVHIAAVRQLPPFVVAKTISEAKALATALVSRALAILDAEE